MAFPEPGWQSPLPETGLLPALLLLPWQTPFCLRLQAHRSTSPQAPHLGGHGILCGILGPEALSLLPALPQQGTMFPEHNSDWCMGQSTTHLPPTCLSRAS